ncbi:hypothetical protein HNY73_021129 [Argiope bruennichi]|uniref:Uncharacterized protein n=1 Tax=Argiope bruennichi TaxID=94029 RepID=A0A8T0EAD0_ARGBR|nr:hypothetical protein HNY73_021129 [Argiope bruennichi]
MVLWRSFSQESSIDYKQLYEAEKLKCEAQAKRAEFWRTEYAKCRLELLRLRRGQTHRRRPSNESDDDSDSHSSKRRRLNDDDAASNEPDEPVGTIPPPRRVRVRQPPLFPRKKYPGPPQNRDDRQNRINEKVIRLQAKERFNALYEDICASCTHYKVPRALFERGMKELVGDRSPDELGIDSGAVPAPGSPKEAMIFRVYRSAHDRAFVARRKTVMDRDVDWAIGHLRGSLNR